MRRLVQYFEKKEVFRNVRSPTVTRTPFRPRDRTTANDFLKCPSVTRTRIFILRNADCGLRNLDSSFYIPNSAFRNPKSNQSFVGEASITLARQDDMIINLNPKKPARFYQLFGDPKILFTGAWISTRVIVDQNNSCRRF